MKVSKLFHWLYAFLMLLPVFFVAGRCLYTIMNENAYQSYYGDTINDETLTHKNYDELEIGKTYEITAINIGTQSSDMGSRSYRLNISNVKAVNFTPSVDLSDAVSFSLYSLSNGISYVNLINSSGTDLLSLNSNNGYTIKYQLVSKNLNGNSITLFNLLNNNLVEYNNYSYLDNAFEYSMDSINDTPLFSWAQTSFLSEPMLYITGLFGMPNNSPVITLLSYWLSISIVWLVFDLVMYVPLLVHRWIDKGIVE